MFSHSQYWWWVPQPSCQGTFAVILVPRVNTVLDTVADQGVVDAHVAMAKESFCLTRSWKTKGKSHAAAVYSRLQTNQATTFQTVTTQTLIIVSFEMIFSVSICCCQLWMWCSVIFHPCAAVCISVHVVIVNITTRWCQSKTFANHTDFTAALTDQFLVLWPHY